MLKYYKNGKPKRPKKTSPYEVWQEYEKQMQKFLQNEQKKAQIIQKLKKY
jgi:hypothetical protein